jgi:glycyl-tRNA synthetase
MDAIVALCKRRGFVYPASEIYGGINGFWDFGPLGTELKNNLRDAWWRDMVKSPPPGPDGRELSMVGIDTAIIQNPRVWEASGHVGGFNDPMQTCRQCKKLFRADHVAEMLERSAWVSELLSALGATFGGAVEVDEAAIKGWIKRGRKTAPGLALVRMADRVLPLLSAADRPLDTETFLRLVATDPTGETTAVVPCPECGGDLTEPRQFNLMFETYVGAVRDEENKSYLRPETAQGIFINYKNVLDTMRVKVPFGIAQIGKSFRNEVTPRNFIFRSREFEQMEMEWFCHPDEARTWYDYWVQARQDWWASLGVDPANLRRREHDSDELAHYSTACADVEYRYPFTAPGYGELEGIAHRGCFDLSRHQEFARLKLEYFDQERNERYVPHVIEPAAGLTRGVLVLICEAYTPDPQRPSKVFMRFHPRMAPIQAAVFPLVNKDGMPEIAEKLYGELRGRHSVQMDVKQSIGKRYARMDEAGTPYCFTVDSDTLKDQSVTVRDRDTAEQERIGIDRVSSYLAERM